MGTAFIADWILFPGGKRIKAAESPGTYLSKTFTEDTRTDHKINSRAYP